MKWELTESDVKKHVDYGSFKRGRDYYLEGRVGNVEVEDGMVSGKVWGSGREAYDTYFTLDERGIEDSECSCPLGGYCKHVATLGLAAIDKITELSGKNLNYREAKIVEEKKPEKFPSLWKTVFHNAFSKNPEENGNLSDLYDKIPYRAEIIFRLSEEKENEWDYRSPKTLKLQARIRLWNKKTGKPSLTALQWRDLYPSQSYKLDTISISSGVKNFLTLFSEELQAEDRYYYTGGKGSWQNLSGSRAIFLWNLLKEHKNFGINMVFGENPSFPAEVSSEGVKAVVLLKDVDGGISAEKAIFCGEKDLSKSETIFFGEDPIFAFVSELAEKGGRGQASFYPVSGKYDPKIFSSLAKPIFIPKKEISAFAEKFLPDLLKRMEVKNISSKISLPSVQKPKLLLNLSAKGQHGISASILWKYGEVGVLPDKEGDIVRDSEENIVAIRDSDSEKNLLEKIQNEIDALGLGNGNLFLGLGKGADLHKMEAVGFLKNILPRLEAIPGVEAVKDPNLPIFKIVSEIPQAEFAVLESLGGNEEEENKKAEEKEEFSSDPDWFDLHIKIKVAGREIILEEVILALDRGEKFLFLEDGNMIDLNQPFFERLRSLMKQAAHMPEGGSGKISVSKFQAGWWEELKELGIVGKQAKAWEDTVNNLLDIKNIPFFKKEPKGLEATLRPYQKEGFSWLAFLREHKLGGVLADDMGLGKTVQSISLICHALNIRKKAKKGKKMFPFLIIAPTSVVENWDSEMKKFAPNVSVIVLRRGDRTGAYEKISKADAVITSYALLHRDEEKLQAVEWDTIIIDEAQMVKNHQSKAYSLIRKLRSSCRLALSGTPLENNTMELWSLFSIVAPGLFPPPERFRDVFQKPIEKQSDKAALEALRRRVRPFMLRRKKELVEKDLPEKTEQVISLPMNDDQRKIYDLYLQRERQRVLGLLKSGGMKEHRFLILTALTRMRQLCLHPVLADPKHSKVSSAKIEALSEHVENILVEDHKIIIYSQFTSFLALIREDFDKRGVKYCYLDGGTKDRKGEIDKFQNNDGIKIFLLSLKAGGVGLNLTKADYCIILDPWWNPAVENQAIARAHRIGQKRKVVVYKFIAKDSIEEKVLKLQEKKKKLFENIMEEGDVFGSLITEEDIKNIFE